jgi:hypothetical protein
MSARNILRSAAHDILKKEARLVVVTPLWENAEFKSEFLSANTTFISFAPRRNVVRQILERVYVPAQLWRFTKSHPVGTLVRLRKKLQIARPMRALMYAVLGNTLGRVAPLMSLLSCFYRSSLRNPAAGKILDENKVDLVFLTHGYIETDCELALEAKARGIPVINLIHSWDNVTCKSGVSQITSLQPGRILMTDLFDRILVWNDVLRDELKELYGYPPERIDVCGIPQFDSYSTLKERIVRESFLKSFGADPNKKLILFCAGSPTLVHDQTAVVRLLVEAVRGGRFSSPAQLVIRSHPGTLQNWQKDFAGPDVFFQTPTDADKALAVSKWERPSGDSELAKSICHCDVLIHCISTVAIEGAVFDRPTIGLGYDGDVSHSDNVRQAYEETTHYSKLMSMGGMRVAVSPDDLLKTINAYFENPELDAEGRARTRNQQCYRIDGKSGERVGRFVVEFLRK